MKTIDFYIRKSWFKIAKVYNHLVTEHDASIAMTMIMLNIDDQEGEYSTAIGPKIGLENTSLARSMNKLEEKKYIYRVPETKDKRKVKIYITKLGIEKRDLAVQIIKDLNNEIIKSVGEKEIIQAIQTIDKISDFIDLKLENLIKNEKENK